MHLNFRKSNLRRKQPQEFYQLYIYYIYICKAHFIVFYLFLIYFSRYFSNFRFYTYAYSYTRYHLGKEFQTFSISLHRESGQTLYAATLYFMTFTVHRFLMWLRDYKSYNFFKTCLRITKINIRKEKYASQKLPTGFVFHNVSSHRFCLYVTLNLQKVDPLLRLLKVQNFSHKSWKLHHKELMKEKYMVRIVNIGCQVKLILETLTFWSWGPVSNGFMVD